MRWSYVLPDPASYGDPAEFEGDLACLREAGYEAVELQIPDPADFDEERVGAALRSARVPMCAFQTGATYASRGNCLSTADEGVRRRTVRLLRSFVDLASRWQAVMVVGSLQGRRSDEPDREAGEGRIREALREVGEYALTLGVTLAFEPVNQGEVGFHNTIASAAAMVRGLGLPSVRLMVDSYHMNIEERDMRTPLAGIADILAHVHLCETNRDVLGTGHWDTDGFVGELRRIGFNGFCSVGVYNTGRTRRQCMAECMRAVKAPAHAGGDRASGARGAGSQSSL